MKKEKEQGWKDIGSLQIVDRDYSGMKYSIDYANKHKNRKDYYGGTNNTVGIEEAVFIKKAPDGRILYKPGGHNIHEEGTGDYKTQFGVFHSDDQGEFGGELITPAGGKIRGNFRFVFDHKDKVYAISTMVHLLTANTAIYRFDNAQDSECIYSTADFCTMLILSSAEKTSGSVYSEDLYCDAIEIEADEIFVVLSGFITEVNSREHHRVCRLIRIKNQTAGIVKEIRGRVPQKINSLIVCDNKLYLGCDKMVCIFDLFKEDVFDGAVYRTCLSVEDEMELVNTC